MQMQEQSKGKIKDQAIWNSEILVFVDKNLKLLINGLICFSDNCSGNPGKGNFNLVYSEGGTTEYLNFQYCSNHGVGQISTNFGTRCRSLNMICIHLYFQVLTSYFLAYFLRCDFPLVLKSHCYHNCAYQLSFAQ